jgi:hypothetical protein
MHTTYHQAFSGALLREAVGVDVQRIVDMANAVNWQWNGKAIEENDVRCSVYDLCVSLLAWYGSTPPEEQCVSSAWSGGFGYTITHGKDDEGNWVNVSLRWGIEHALDDAISYGDV